MVLTGCGTGSMSDLETYVKKVLKRPGQPPEELPPIEPYVVYTYQSSDGVDPFEPYFQEDEKTAEAAPNTNLLQPDTNPES